MEINNNIFKKDQDGLYYIDNSKLLTPFSFNELVNPSFRRKFYTIDGIDNFIIKETYKKTNYFLIKQKHYFSEILIILILFVDSSK